MPGHPKPFPKEENHYLHPRPFPSQVVWTLGRVAGLCSGSCRQACPDLSETIPGSLRFLELSLRFLKLSLRFLKLRTFLKQENWLLGGASFAE